jgi:membrane protease YdiL (CAAX protease family)
MNPIHVAAVLPIGLFLGWLRWMSGSIWPSMAGHFVNNSVATAMSVYMGADAEIGFIPSLGGFGFTLLIAGAAAAWYHHQTPTVEP